MPKTNQIACIFVFIGFATLGWSDDSSKDQSEAKLREDFKKEALHNRIKLLVDQLVSPNPKPITGDDDKTVAPNYRLPTGFDRSKQKVVLIARRDLAQIGPAAFPYLIERWDDDRHCMTMFHKLSIYSHNFTVGYVSQKIVFDQLQPYSYWPFTDDGEPRGKPKRPAYPSANLDTKAAALQWWETHKDKSLLEMQLEVLDWVIAEEAKRPQDFTAQEREFLIEVRRTLLEKNEPMQPGNYDWMCPET